VAEAVLQILMKADVDSLIGAGRHQRSADQASITADSMMLLRHSHLQRRIMNQSVKSRYLCSAGGRSCRDRAEQITSLIAIHGPTTRGVHRRANAVG
jgi:hypothetical protein